MSTGTRTRRSRAAVLVVALLACVLLVFRSNVDARVTTDQRAVLSVARQARAAVLADRPAAVCRLLTHRARSNSLILHGLNADGQGRPRPTARDCTTAIGYMIDDARSYGKLKSLASGGRYHSIKLVSISRRQAHVTVGPDGQIFLTKSGGRWYADHANFAPFDGSSGE